MAKKRLTPQERFAKKRAEWVAENPNPYHLWPDSADHVRMQITKAVGDLTFIWNKGKADKDRLLTVDDLSVGYWAVDCTSGKGLNYGQLDHAFKVCLGKGCHRNKAAAVLSALLGLGLIMQTGNYSTGRRGNVYEIPKVKIDESLDWLKSRTAP